MTSPLPSPDDSQHRSSDELNKIFETYGVPWGTARESLKGAIAAHIKQVEVAAVIAERKHTWDLINDIRYQNVSLDFAKELSLERLTKSQVDQQMAEEAHLQQLKGGQE